MQIYYFLLLVLQINSIEILKIFIFWQKTFIYTQVSSNLQNVKRICPRMPAFELIKWILLNILNKYLVMNE